MSDGKLFRPSEAGIRSPTSNEQKNRSVVNPPRFPQIGGFSGVGKGVKKNMYKIRKPGG